MILRLALLSLAASGVLCACGSDVDIPTGGGDPGGGGPGGTAQTTGSIASGTQSAGSQSSGSQSTGSTGSQSSGTQSTGSMTSGSMSSGTGSTSTGQMVCASQTPCQDCVATACADVWCECTQSMECGALFQCWQGCSDQACSQSCMQQYPDAISNAILVSNCGATACAMSCPQAGDPLMPCGECLYTSCDSEMNACLSTPDCTGLWTCFSNCGQFDLTCQQGCYDTYPGGAQPLEDVFNCAQAECEMVCN